MALFARGQPSPRLLRGALQIIQTSFATAVEHADGHRGRPNSISDSTTSDEEENECVLKTGAERETGVQALLQYGPTAGTLRFRTAMVALLNDHLIKCMDQAQAVELQECKFDIGPESIMLTSGSSQALDWICQRYTTAAANSDDAEKTLVEIQAPQERPWVLTETPTYFLALNTFADHGLSVEGVSVKLPGEECDCGDNVACAFVETDECMGYGKGFVSRVGIVLDSHASPPRLFYCIPTFQNPTGRTMSLATRLQLVALCQVRGVLLVCDDVYDMLYFQPRNIPPPPVFALDKTGKTVLSVGTFSKIAAPGLRLGWIACGAGPDGVASADSVRPDTHSPGLLPLASSGWVQSGGGANAWTSEVLARAIGLGILETHILWARAEYERMCTLLCDELTAQVPADRLKIWLPRGGYFVWCRLLVPSDGVFAVNTVSELATALSADRVTILPGARCVAPALEIDATINACFRLSFAHQTPESTRWGVAAIARALALRNS